MSTAVLANHVERDGLDTRPVRVMLHKRNHY